MLNTEALHRLIAAYKNDPETLDFIKSCFDSFEQYHRAVLEEQLFPVIYGGASTDGEEYRQRRTALDRSRTLLHNSVITNVSILNRMAAQAGTPPVYDGVVSEERPYRRQVADAVFATLEHVINNRS